MEKSAFIELIRENRGIIESLCRSYYKTLADREDVTQDIILNLWNSIDSFKGESNVSTWLYRVSLNTILNKKRRESEPTQIYDLDHALAEVNSTNFNDDLELLKSLLQVLNETDKALMILYLEGYKNKEIAEILDQSATNISTRLNRIKISLRKTFLKEFNGTR